MANYSGLKNSCVLISIVEKQAMSQVQMNCVVGTTSHWLVKQVGCGHEVCYFSSQAPFCLIMVSLKP